MTGPPAPAHPAPAQVRFSTLLKGVPKAVQADESLGGLRASRASMLKVPGLAALGAQTRELIDKAVEAADEASKDEDGVDMAKAWSKHVATMGQASTRQAWSKHWASMGKHGASMGQAWAST